MNGKKSVKSSWENCRILYLSLLNLTDKQISMVEMCYNFYFCKLLPWIWQSRIYTIFMIIWIYFFKNHIMQGATPCIEMEMAWWWINWPFHGLTDVPEQAIHTSKLPFLQYYLLTYIRDGWGIDPIRLWPDLCHLWWIRGWLE